VPAVTVFQAPIAYIIVPFKKVTVGSPQEGGGQQSLYLKLQ